MHLEEMLDTASQLIFELRGKDLTDLQSGLLKASWENQTYDSFAQNNQYSSDYVKDIGSDLWDLLSQALGKKVNKKNFRQALRQYHCNKQHNLYFKILNKRDVSTLPDVSLFFGRGEERATLQNWILQDSCRLIALLGIGGVGKTTLAAKLLEDVQDKFDYVIWRSLRNAPPLNNLLGELILFLSDNRETTVDIKTLLRCLQDSRCLLVLDNVETILLPGKLAGEYCHGYEDYGELFREVGGVNHRSCLILTSREKPVEVAELSGIELRVRYLRVRGCEETVRELIRSKGLSGSCESKYQLCEHYDFNPLAVNIVASSIQDLFDGEIKYFLEQNTFIFKGIHRLLTKQFERLSDLEKVIMYWLAINRSWTSISELREDIYPAVSNTSLLEALESLCQRSLIEKKAGRYTQQPVVMEYITGCFIEKIVNEIVSSKISLFTSHALIKTTASDYIKESQIRLILKPIGEKIQGKLGYITILSQRIKNILQLLRDKQASISNYGVGNLINLANYLQVDLSYLDFSNLEIWQADLQNIELHNVNFTKAHFHKSNFASTIFGIHCIAINSTGKLLATGETCNDIHIWQLSDNQQLISLKGHTDWVQSVVFSPDNQVLASASFDTTIKLWDISSGNCIKTLQGHHAPVMSVIFIPVSNKFLLASCSFDGTIKLWNISSGDCLKTLYGHTKEVYCINFNLKSNLLASGSVDESIKLWNLSTGECIKTLLGHSHNVWSLAFTDDGKNLISSSSDKTIKIWDVVTGICTKTLVGHYREVMSVQLSKDNKIIASGSRDTTIRLWDIETGRNIKTFLGNTSWVWSAIFSPNNQHLIAGGYDFNVKFWEIKTGRCLKRIQGNYKQTYAVTFSHDGRLLANSYWLNNNSIKIWDVATGKYVKILQGHHSWVTCIAFSRNNKLLASGCFDKTIKIWDVATGNCLKTMQGHHGELTSIIFSPDNKFVFSSSIDETIKIWNIDTGEVVKDLLGHDEPIHSLAFNYKNNILASSGKDQKIKLWNINTGECLKTLKGHTNWIFSVALNRKGNILASGSHDGTIRLFDLNTGHCINVLDYDSPRVYSVAFNQRGNLLVSGHCDGTLKIWDVNTGECLRILQSSNHEIWSLAFSPVCLISPSKLASVLACSGYDEVVNFWDLEKGEVIKTLEPKKLYKNMNITKVTGLTEAQKKTLFSLGAITTGNLAC